MESQKSMPANDAAPNACQVLIAKQGNGVGVFTQITAAPSLNGFIPIQCKVQFGQGVARMRSRLARFVESHVPGNAAILVRRVGLFSPIIVIQIMLRNSCATLNWGNIWCNFNKKEEINVCKKGNRK